MKRILTLVTFLALFSSAYSQNDLSVTNITAPVSGCALSATENVTIKIFNFGNDLPAGTIFNVSYNINAGPPVTETITLAAILLQNSTYTYTFATQANLSVPGVYVFNASVALAGDINASNDAFNGYSVTNTAPSVGGTVSGGTNVCISGNAGTLTLAGNTGSVLRWEYSTDGGATWINISNTTTSQSYLNLVVPTLYRAVVQNGACATANSTIASMTIDNASVGGTLSSNATVCTGINSGTLTLSGKTGAVQHWEQSIDGGVTWTNIANITTSYTYTNLVITTKYRVLVQNGSCAAVYSTTVTITVSPATVGGTLAPVSTTVCSGSNAGTITLSGKVGAVIRWEYSIDMGITWTNIANVTTTQNYLNLVSTRLYRVRVQSSPCAVVYSANDTINVTSVSTGGSIAPAASQVCTGVNGGTLTLSGNNGAIIQWEFSTDGGVTWTIIANTTTTNNYLNLITTTMYRALVQNGGCAAAYSATATVTVNPNSVGGSVSGGTTVCASGNSGTLTLSGQSGSIVQWESSVDNVIWTVIANTTATNNYLNLLDTTYYHVIVQSGVCPADTAIPDTVVVDPVTVGGTISPAADTVCSGLGAGTLTLGGYTGGVVQWEYSTDGGVTWIIISNTTNTQNYVNLTTPTIYRALVKSGVCSQAYSTQSVISINAQAVGGTLYSNTTVCGGSNSGTLTLVGYSGSITQWESSIDNGVTWSAIANTSNTNNYLNLIDTTLYRVIVNSGVCPTDTSTGVTITVDAPSVGGSVSANAAVCGGNNSGTLTLSGETGNVVGWEYSTDGGVTWINISNTTTMQGYLNLMSTTEYRARVANGVCPSDTSMSDTITVSPMTVPGTITGSTATCEGTGNGVLTLTGYTGSILGWETSSDGITWSPIPFNTPSVNWSDPLDTTYYHVLVASGVCPLDTSTIGTILVYPKPVAGFTSPTVCFGTPTQFTDTTTIATGGLQFHNWDFGDSNGASIATSPNYTYATADTFNVMLIVMSDHNCSDTALGMAIVNPLPNATITAGGSLVLCSGDSVQLSVPSAPQNHYMWSTGDSVNAIYAMNAGNYVVTVTDTTSGCAAMDSSMISVLPSPVASAGPDTSVSAGSSIMLNGTGGLVYSWQPTVGLSDPNVMNPNCTPPYTVTYTLTVTDLNGCSDTDAVKVTFLKDYNVIISNLVTINGDGFNDVWNIQNIEYYPENKVTIYNRNGMKVYEQEAYNNGWNGTYNGAQLPDGTYYYVLEFTDTGETFKGAVTLVSGK
ncbi:MAG: gliding motility-associated C-terminal domain-containing protein [Bacteroidetes bacterium]|nr:gliding motility-associated C-terminal domain-containing protein [Bacteroidota bacterium]